MKHFKAKDKADYTPFAKYRAKIASKWDSDDEYWEGFEAGDKFILHDDDK